jgi:hypothetical protein
MTDASSWREVLAARLSSANVSERAVVWADSPEDPGARQPPHGPWLLVSYGAQVLVGGMGRGKFATYEALWTVEDAIDLAVRLAASPLPPMQRDATDLERAAGERTTAGILARTAERGGSPGPTALGVGDMLDFYGAETSHHLFAFGTPFQNRSQPPSDVGAPYFAFEVTEPLPEAVTEGIAVAWFEPPGGGAMVVLDRPIRWYVDHGHLAPRS